MPALPSYLLRGTHAAAFDLEAADLDIDERGR